MALKKIRYEIGNGSDVGCVRQKNEDSFVCVEPSSPRQRQRRGYLLAVCDGMGGAVGGATASSLAIEAINATYFKDKNREPGEALRAGIGEANRAIHERAQSNPELRGMGTTAVAVALVNGKAHVAHVGDSRCYLARERQIKALTQDHTMVNKMVMDGLITPEQARNHPDGHILNRSVGVGENVEVEVLAPPAAIEPEDQLILCSDGLTGQVMDEEILDIVISSPPQQSVERLIELAKRRGGPDNITVQIVRAHTGEASGRDLSTKIIRAPRRRRGALALSIVLILVLALAAVGALWFYKVVDFKSLTGWEWVPNPDDLFRAPAAEAPPTRDGARGREVESTAPQTTAPQDRPEAERPRPPEETHTPESDPPGEQ